MNLKELRDYFDNMVKGTEFNFKLSEPFSWRGSYDEVCFSIEKIRSTREEALINIDMAFESEFIGWKGGEYYYNDFTDVNFEGGEGEYSDKQYCQNLISEIQEEPEYPDYENKLVYLAFEE